MRKPLSLLLTASLLFSASPAVLAKDQLSAGANDNLGVYYEVFVNSFYDSNKDSHGDLNGITHKLDYLNDGNSHTNKDLGVNTLWLMPIYPSPTYHKYDTTDFYNVDPQYGTLEDFRRMTDEAHQRGLKIILDFALNHSSNKHPWFQAAMKDKNSPYRNYYIWADNDTDLNEKGPWGQKLWYESYPGSGDYYYAVFDKAMPDLNYDNPKVREEAINIGQFWLKQGADGFRLDAAMHIYTGETDKNVDLLKEFSQGLKQVKPDAYLVGEVWDRPNNIAPYYQTLDSNFNFDLAGKIVDSVKSGQDNGLVSFEMDTLDLYQSFSTTAIDAPFLTNHDQARTMSVLNGDVDKAKMAASILLTMPGNPFIYYGEEIGMLGEGPDEYKREPFRWYQGDGEGQTTWEAPRYNVGTSAVSVDTQDKDKNSLLNHYRDLIHVRESSPALMRGDLNEVQTGDSRVLGYTRNYQEDSVLILHNLSKEAVTVTLTEQEAKRNKQLFSSSNETKMKYRDGNVQVTLPASSTIIVQ
ncbi:alpha-amylase family glycosyl hydrolase [Bacillus sp. 03113]|uniref:alpha-amylase family glycosyl hydrolase n=1 Tax=Bacillus sp. 03113 TaxID=2578211 RepID=UPI00114134D0|nr:alpha-amylase family glycosyl hydrolase [Bacillus sp. 03113]